LRIALQFRANSSDVQFFPSIPLKKTDPGDLNLGESKVEIAIYPLEKQYFCTFVDRSATLLRFRCGYASGNSRKGARRLRFPTRKNGYFATGTTIALPMLYFTRSSTVAVASVSNLTPWHAARKGRQTGSQYSRHQLFFIRRIIESPALDE